MPMPNEPEEIRAGKYVKAWKRGAYVLLAAGCCALVYLWAGSFFPEFMRWRLKMAETRPLRTEAAALALTYDKVLENPAAAAGKPVIWCVQNRGEFEVTVGGEETKRLKLLNYPAMPLFSGSKHSACAEMLLVITEVSPEGPRARITARFVGLS